MGKNRSRGERGLIDMSSSPPPEQRYSPPQGRTVGEAYPIDIDHDHRIVVRMDTYRKWVVDFALMQDYTGNEWDEHVFRIDCDHGEVHSHQFFRDSEDVDRKVIEVIPPRNGGWECVDRNYSECYDRLLRDYGEHYRRWDP